MVDQDGCITATATFTDSVEGKRSLSGGIVLLGRYVSSNPGSTVTWVFDFDGELYVYEGTDKTGSSATPANSNYTSQRHKEGTPASTPDLYQWTVHLNMKTESWPGKVVVTDEIGAGHELAPYDGVSPTNAEAAAAEGYHGVSVDGTFIPYVRITIYDWDTMRQDYNNLFGDNSPLDPSDDTVSDPRFNSGQVYMRYATGSNASGNLSYDIPSGIVTSYMYNCMRTAKDSITGEYLYLTRYTDTALKIILTSDGFKMEFPEDAFLDGKSLHMTYFTKLTAVIEQEKLTNSIKISGAPGNNDGTTTAPSNIGGHAWMTGTQGEILLLKSDVDQRIYLEDVKFQLKNPAGDSMTATTDSKGQLIFVVDDNPFFAESGNYTLTEITTPKGYLGLNKDIILTVDASTQRITNVAVDTTSKDASNGAEIPGICMVSKNGLIINVLNEPDPTSKSVALPLVGQKNLSGQTLTDDMFNFVVSDDSDNIVAIGSNTANGIINFSDITFNKAGSYTYTVYEENDNEPGYSYDPIEYTVIVEVEDSNDELVISSVTINDKAVADWTTGSLGEIIVFNNEYKVSPVKLQLTGNKTLAGKVLTDEMFSFIVSDVENNTVATAYNKADGTVTFTDITLKQAGTYTYTISEIIDKKINYTYDSVKYTVVVQVEDIDGKLVITSLSVNGVSYGVDGNLKDIIKFSNRYSTGGGGGGGGGGGTTLGTPPPPNQSG